MRTDFDFHPDEPTARVFVTPEQGVLRLDDEVAVTEAMYDTVALRHYAFADRWFKINVTTDLAGRPAETGADGLRFAFNCDIATPMEREGDATFAVDLFVDVLVRADGHSVHVGDEDELAKAFELGLLSTAEHMEVGRRETAPCVCRDRTAPAMAQ